MCGTGENVGALGLADHVQHDVRAWREGQAHWRQRAALDQHLRARGHRHVLVRQDGAAHDTHLGAVRHHTLLRHRVVVWHAALRTPPSHLHSVKVLAQRGLRTRSKHVIINTYSYTSIPSIYTLSYFNFRCGRRSATSTRSSNSSSSPFCSRSNRSTKSPTFSRSCWPFSCPSASTFFQGYSPVKSSNR